MPIRTNEQRMIWLMLLIVVAVSAWFLKIHIISYVCGVAFIMSVMQYVDAIDRPIQQHLKQAPTSKVPLYLASLTIFVGAIFDWNTLVAIGIALWVFFFLRWLQRLEHLLLMLQPDRSGNIYNTEQQFPTQITHKQVINAEVHELSLSEQMQQWLFQGNPVLKAAIVILTVGLVLLLRFAAEHWQLSLAFKLGLLALLGCGVVIFGYVMQAKNRSFALGVEALGLSILFLSLFFAYDQHVISNLLTAIFVFIAIQALAIVLSLKQQSSELAIMAMVVAYIAPFTLPEHQIGTTALIGYYLLINIAVAILSSLRAWKYLNQIAFLITLMIGGGYVFIHGSRVDQWSMTALILAHSLIFIWLGLRFSQLRARPHVAQMSTQSLTDVLLIFSVPLSAFACLYLIHFNDAFWQASFSAFYAGIFALFWYMTQRMPLIRSIAHSYLSLMLIFLVFIPPILLPEQWSVMGWTVQGVLIYFLALHYQSLIARKLAQGLFIVAVLSSVYYLFEINPVPKEIFWTLSICYLLVVVGSQWTEQYRQQLSHRSIAFLSFMALFSSLCLFALIQDDVYRFDANILSLLVVSVIFLALNILVIRRDVTWSWLIPKWCAMTPLLLIYVILLLNLNQQGILVWENNIERAMYAAVGLIQACIWLHPLRGVKAEKEWVSLAVLISLAGASIALLPHMPYLSVMILPLLFCFWCYRQSHDHWKIFWQSKASLMLMALWMICSQLFSEQAFVAYVLPVLNPFDLISIAMLIGFLWMLSQQTQAGRDRGLVAVYQVLSLLWLSSYIVIRALHYYYQTPFNQLSVWHDSTVQLSLTVLWVVLAWIMMWYATTRLLKPVWLLGSSILVLVTLKLVLFDLSHIGTLTRVLSFLLAGGVMLIIAYLAPMPDSKSEI